MRLLIIAALGLSVSACQTTQPIAQSNSAPVYTAESMAPLPPIYEPVVSMRRVNATRLRQDMAACRASAAPQEAAVRQARDQQAAGNTLAAVGAVASLIPVKGLKQSRLLGNLTDTAQDVGNSTADNAANNAELSTDDYALVLNTCLRRKRYRLIST